MKNTKILGALAVAGVVAMTGSAFTATSTIDDGDIHVGSVLQSVSGATFTDVKHTYNAATDTTTALSARTAEVLSEKVGVVTVSVNDGGAESCTVTNVDTDADTFEDASDVSCDIEDRANVTSVRFVVNG